MDENNLKEVEIPPKQIFELMQKNIYDNYYNYSWSIINKDYLSTRKSLFHTLHKITIKMGFKSQTFFLSAHYLDIIFTKKRRINININTLGLACLCLSAKFCENDPIVPHLQYFIRIYNNIMGYKNIISMSDLKRTEVLVLKILNYKLNYFTIYDFNSFLFGHGILKLEQLNDIQNGSRRLYRSKRKEYSLNPANSLLIKSILEKIYKKSRYYLDDIINDTKLCFKYNPLYISIYIMKKSIQEILKQEQKVNEMNEKEQEEFYDKTNSNFKHIMLDFYKIDYETNEQYKEIMADEEILEIFEGKIKNEEAPAPIAGRRFQKKEEEKLKNNKLENNLNDNLNDNLNINNEIESRSKYPGTYTNGFYNRINSLKIKANLDNINLNKNERNILSSRKENSNAFSNKINNENYDNDSKDDDNDEDIKDNLNINELQNIKWNNKNINSNKGRNSYNSSNNSKKQEKEESSLSNNRNIIQNKYLISSNNRYSKKTDTYNSIKSTNTINKNYLNNKNYGLTYSVFAYRGYKMGLNKNTDLNTEKNSPKFDTTNVRNKYSNYIKLNKLLKMKGINNTGNERNEYSYNTNDTNTNNNNFNYNTIKKFEKKPYFRKLIHTNTNTNSNDITSTLNSINRNGISSYYYSNNYNSQVDRNKTINNNNEIFSLNRNKNDINNKDVLTSKINTFYSRIRVKNRNNENNLSNKTINAEEETNNIKPEITTTSSRFRRRFYNNNNNVNNNDISAELNNANALIIKEKNKKEIESYSQSNQNTINSSIFSKISAHNIFRRKNRILNMKVNIENSDNSDDIKDDNKGVTSRNFYKYPINTNKINVKMSRATDNRTIETNKSYEPSKRISYLLARKNSELNNTLKEINKARAKNLEKEISVNTIDTDDNKKVYQSIRLKYLNLHKNKNLNINKTTNDINKSKTISDIGKIENNSTANINSNNKICNNNNNQNINSLRAKFAFRNRTIIANKLENNNLNNNTNNNNINNNSNPLYSRAIEGKNKYKNIAESSIYKIINKTKTLFSRKEEEPKKIEKNDKKNFNNNNINNNTNVDLNFYKSQQNFYKPAHRKIEINNNSNNEKEENENKQNSKLNNTEYLRNIINRNKISKENKDNPNSKSQKNSSTIVINNNININIGNKTNNIKNEYVKYKNVYKKNSIPELNLNSKLLQSHNNNLNNNNNAYRSEKTNNSSNSENNGNTFSNFINKFQFYRKFSNKINNNNNNNSGNSNNSNHAEKSIFFHRK